MKLTLYSTGIGVAGALLLAYGLKKFRFLTRSPIHEIILIFVTGYLTYMIAEALALSAIVSLLACGICMGHYAWYNLSASSKNNSSVSVEAIGFAAEAFVFVYIGLTAFSYNDLEWSVKYIIAEIPVAAACRFIAVMLLLYTISWVTGHKRQLELSECFFLCIAGMI